MLARLLHSQDTKVLERALSAMEALSDKGDGRDMRLRAIIDSGATDKLVELLGHHKLGILAPALQIVSLTGADALRDALRIPEHPPLASSLLFCSYR
jgi:importin subunit alpha-1